MTTIQLFPDDSYNQKTIRQGHPPGRTNRKGASTTWWFWAAGRLA
jgi:hypothetical protein